MASTVTLVDTLPILNECLADISPLPVPSNEISLAVDIEGVDLCRNGKVSIVQIMSNLSGIIWLVDVTVLGREAFDHVDPNGRSLRAILEGTDAKKVFYDVRNDADALYNIYGVDMKNVYDLQILELAVRHSVGQSVRFLHGLGRSIETYAAPPINWKVIKDAGVALFAPEKGGSYSVFENRPVDPRILAYCAQDVVLLFKLQVALEGHFGIQGSNWKSRIVTASTKRVAEARSSFYTEGGQRALAPAI